MLEELIVVALSNTIYYLWCVHLCLHSALNLAVNHLQTIWIEQVAEVAFLCGWVLASEQTVVQANLGIYARVALYPVDS